MSTAFFALSLIDGNNGFVINGNQDDQRAGSSVSKLGDINGDGIDDLIIGVPGKYDANNRSFTGVAYVVFGQKEFASSLDLATLDGSNGFVLHGVDGEERAGFSVSDAGDVNQDGIADLIIGAPDAGELVEDMYGYGNLFRNSRGASYVVFGNDNGFDSSLDLATLDGSNGFVVSGINPEDRLGRSVSSVGDFNRDGVDDIILGAPNYYSQDEDGGNSYLIFGQREFSASLDLTALDGSNGLVISGINAGDDSGYSVSGAGDINGDGFDDLIIGAPNADPADSEDSYNKAKGASYVVFGGTDVGVEGSFELANLDGNNGFAINGSDTNPNFPENSGFSVSGAGDLNGDGFDDLIIGASYSGVHGRNFNATYVVFGQAEAFNSSLDLSALDGSNGFTIENISGYSVSSAGDINGDGLDDIIVGNFNVYADESSLPYILFGRPTGFPPVVTAADFDGNRGFIVKDSSVYDYEFRGGSVSGAGDLNQDGIDDLIIGVPEIDRSYVIFGKSDGFAPQLDLDSNKPDFNFVAYFNGNSVKIVGNDLTLSDPDSPNLSGATIRITNLLDNEAELLTVDTLDTNITDNYDRQTGILNLSGIDAIAKYQQVLQTITYNNTADLPNSEARMIEFVVTDEAESRKESAVATTTLNFQGGLNLVDLDGGNGFVINGINQGDRSGSSVSNAGDFNADGIDDIIIGAIGAESASANGDISGQSYVLFGSDREFAAEFNLDALNGSNGFALNGVEGDRAGNSVSGVGDFNGDGFDDVIIGADTGGENEQGKSYVVFGSESGFDTELDLSSLDGSNGFALSGFEANLGNSVSGAGDINKDGLDDIIVGSSEQSAVIFGSENQFDAEFDLSSLNGNNGFVILSDGSLRSVSSAGDVNGDGIDDLIIGVHSYSYESGSEPDFTYVIFGSESAFSNRFDLSSLDGDNGFILNGVEKDKQLGNSVSSAGDINADGIDDIIIRASESSYVVFGSATGFDASFDLKTLDGNNGFAIDGLNEYDFSNSSVDGAGDFNGDGIDDLIIGSLGNIRENYVIFGSNNQFSASLDVNNINSSQGFVIRGIDEYEDLGISVSGAGDINNDGIDDIIIGAETGDVDADRTYAGKSYVLFGSTSLRLDLNGSDADINFQTIFAGETIAIVDRNLTIESVDVPNLASATIEITNLLDGESEILAVDTSNTAITASYDATGTLTLNGIDTVANYQQVLRTVSYNNTAENRDLEPRRIEFVVNDGETDSNRSAFATTTVRMFNQEPTVSNPIDNQTINQDRELILTLADDTFSDRDRDELTLNATLADGSSLPPWLNFDRDTATFSGTPTAEDIGTIAVAVSANDGNGGIARETFDLTVNAFEPSRISHHNNHLFTLSGTNNPFLLLFNLIESNTVYVNEVGVFAVDDDLGTINGIAPDETGYLEAALQKAQVVFSALPDNTFPDFTPSRHLNFDLETNLGFLLVSNSTVETALFDLAAGNNPSNVFVANTFALTEDFDHLQVSSVEDSLTLAWEDLIDGGDRDFNDLVLTVEIADDTPVAHQIQGKPERELIDLRDLTNQVNADFTIFGDTVYDNSVGFYLVANEQGEVLNSFTGELVAPQDAEYASVVIEHRLDLNLDLDTANLTTQLAGDVILAPYLIANGTVEEFLATNPHNQINTAPLAYFVYSSANPDSVDHVRLLGDNQFGFEDLYGGGDLDYNDFVFQVDL